MAASKHQKEIFNTYGPTKPVPGFDDYYCTPQGRIVSTKYNKVRELNATMCNGYHVVDLAQGASRQRLYVHMIVALCWVKNSKGFKYIRHLDNKRLNNSSANLKWGEREDCYKYGLTGKWQQPGDTAWDRHWANLKQ